jgi:hypothetical protein
LELCSAVVVKPRLDSVSQATLVPFGPAPIPPPHTTGVIHVLLKVTVPWAKTLVWSKDKAASIEVLFMAGKDVRQSSIIDGGERAIPARKGQ